jgi:hemerythrin-like domain-containing protein
MEPTVRQTRFMGDLLAEHQELMEKIADLEKFWHEVDELGIGPKCQELADRVAGIRSHLQQHFDAEERGGYLGPALAVAPRFTQEADELRAQHVTMLQTLDSLGGRLRSGDHELWNAVCSEIEAFVRELEHHEHRENGIMQAAFNDDGGVGD